MSKLSFQFHVMPDEVGFVVDTVLLISGGTVAVFKGREGKPIALEPNVKSEMVSNLKAIAFTRDRSDLNVQSFDEFRQKNPDALIFEIGEMTQKGLKESWLYAMSENAETMRTWRKVTRKLSASMISNVVAINPVTGASAPVKGHRFSAGAKEAFMQGVRMLPVAGNSELVIAMN
jgi:hypothetical protein